jgi:hypothetical protein
MDGEGDVLALGSSLELETLELEVLEPEESFTPLVEPESFDVHPHAITAKQIKTKQIQIFDIFMHSPLCPIIFNPQYKI